MSTEITNGGFLAEKDENDSKIRAIFTPWMVVRVGGYALDGKSIVRVENILPPYSHGYLGPRTTDVVEVVKIHPSGARREPLYTAKLDDLKPVDKMLLERAGIK
jgi:hypothetical protein